MTKAVAFFCVVAATAVTLVAGCDDRRRDWDSCYTERCAAGYVCTSDHRCVPRGYEDQPADGGRRPDGAPAVDTPALEAGKGALSVDAPAPPDAPMDSELDVAVADAPLPVDVGVDRGVDTFVPDAPGSCAVDEDCPLPAQPHCVDQVCVGCRTGAQCHGGTPICSVAHTCVSCAAVDAGCASPTPVCQPASGHCVECLTEADCTVSAEKSFCAGNACVGCAGAASDACAKRDPSKPVCGPAGACVECMDNADCTVADKPLCEITTHACKRCSSDGECQALPGGPGVCMGQDGHCATDSETIYVGSSDGVRCSDSGSPGSAAVPYCSLQLAVMTARSRGIPLVVATGELTGGFTGVTLSVPLTVVGKGVVITPSPGADGISIIGGDLTLRGITVRGTPGNTMGIGVNAAPAGGNTVMLRMDGCVVVDNPGGGILLNGAAFVVTNTTVSRNGPNSAAWGGIYVQNPPVAGPTTLSHVAIIENNQVGLACSSSLAATNTGSGVLATGNAGGVEISSVCGIDACTAGSEGCGVP